jgi:HEAT repeat protein
VFLIFVALTTLLRLDLPLRPGEVAVAPTTTEVREVAAIAAGGVFWDKRPVDALVARGSDAFPAYEAILRDPKSEPAEVTGVLNLLCRVAAHKERFVPLVVPYLAAENASVRRSAVRLIGQIGTPSEGAILAALLSDEERSVAYRAAEALAATGGKRELTAFDAWLRSGAAYRDDTSYVQYVKACRDMLEKRLKEAQKDKK